MNTLERVLDIYGPTLFKEAERFARIKALSVSLEILRGARRIAMNYFFALIWCVLFTTATFSFVFYGLFQLKTTGTLLMDGFLVFSGLLWVASLGVAAYFLREKRWINAFDIERKLNSTLVQPPPPPPLPSSPTLDEASVSRMIDAALQKRFATRKEPPEFRAHLH